ncbi:MAG: branched-chain amino acid ABC transporter substrate-binding protein [Chloroflexi bacterium]|nr:branched-chain amino acid ABC transporter substrate-binding protein [Chloroflexota bacterium]
MRIGLIGPFSGIAAAFGQDMLKGAQMAIDAANASSDFNGKRLAIDQADDRADPSSSPAAARKLIADGVVVAVGPATSASALAAEGLLNQAKIPMIAPAAGDPRITDQSLPFVFRTAGRWDQEPAVIATSLLRNAKIAALVADKSPYGQVLATAMRTEMSKAGLRPVLDESVDSGTKDFAPIVSKFRPLLAPASTAPSSAASRQASADIPFAQLTSVSPSSGVTPNASRSASAGPSASGGAATSAPPAVAASPSSQAAAATASTAASTAPASPTPPPASPTPAAPFPQQTAAVFYAGYAAEGGALARQLRDAGITSTIGLPDAGEDQALIAAAGAAADGAILAYPPEPSSIATAAQFLTDYKKRYGTAASLYALETYDAVRLALDAIKRAGGSDGEAVRQSLVATRDFNGVYWGKMSFDARGDLQGTTYVGWTVKAGKFTPLSGSA